MQPILKTTEETGSGFSLTQIYYGRQEPSGTLFGLLHYSFGTNNVKVETAPLSTGGFKINRQAGMREEVQCNNLEEIASLHRA